MDKKKGKNKDKSGEWTDRAADYMDDAAEKLQKSKAMKKAGGVVDNATKKVFRKAGRFWGRAEHYLKKKMDDLEKEDDENRDSEEKK